MCKLRPTKSSTILSPLLLHPSSSLCFLFPERKKCLEATHNKLLLFSPCLDESALLCLTCGGAIPPLPLGGRKEGREQSIRVPSSSSFGALNEGSSTTQEEEDGYLCFRFLRRFGPPPPPPLFFSVVSKFPPFLSLPSPNLCWVGGSPPSLLFLLPLFDLFVGRTPCLHFRRPRGKQSSLSFFLPLFLCPPTLALPGCYGTTGTPHRLTAMTDIRLEFYYGVVGFVSSTFNPLPSLYVLKNGSTISQRGSSTK